ncbi:DUF4179 domain-containing protein [Metabacillus litoralis]|jgi:hypothetical protein|uniref:DUF4179 domain-containing protein n=1 Tax=Metabacillus litoralis TaxID=152268 RepID=UPI00203F54C1|nr:DUF4179 domain-containing protein [Metabacillus litoralis]MCM3651043.1 DUF4179 domain-containing protein [Metabacillus litoralis]
MKRVEERLIDEKKRLDAVKVPEDLEARLRNSLNNTPKRTKRRAPIWVIAAVALLFMSIAGYNYNAFAYYGKKLFGFDEVMTDTLKELNNDGMGQIIEKQTKLEDGTDFIINGIITDANQLILYYTLSNPNGIDEHTEMFFRPSKVTGFLTNSFASFGTSLMNNERTELKGTMSFEPVSPFAKKLTLHYDQQLENNQMIEQSISFSYHPNEALQTEMKQPLKKKFTVDKGTVTFNSITATPASTVIKGTLNVENFDRVESALHGIELIANGRSVQLMGSGNQSSLKGQVFEVRYDALPKQLDSLQLVIKEFVGYEKLEENIALATIKNEPIPIESKELWVKDVSTTVQGVEITIATENDVMLDRVSIKTHNEVIPLKTTVNQTHTELEDGRIMKERTLLFDTTEEPEYLLIQGMHYMKQYNHTLKIRVD